MPVYIVRRHFAHEGSDIKGVWSDQRDAVKQARGMLDDGIYPHDGYMIDVIVMPLDAAADDALADRVFRARRRWKAGMSLMDGKWNDWEFWEVPEYLE